MKSRIQFSLKSLLMVMGFVAIGLSVWYYMPDGDNTFPINWVVSPAALREAGIQTDSQQPHVIVLGPAQETSKTMQCVELALINPTRQPIQYFGFPAYGLNSGKISPLCHVQINENGGWQEGNPVMCGPGVLRVKPGRAGHFVARYSACDKPVRFGVSCTWVDEAKNVHEETIWSNEWPPTD